MSAPICEELSAAKAPEPSAFTCAADMAAIWPLEIEPTWVALRAATAAVESEAICAPESVWMSVAENAAMSEPARPPICELVNHEICELEKAETSVAFSFAT